MKLPLLIVMLSGAALADAGVAHDAGVDVPLHADFSAPLYDSCPTAPPMVELDGGWKLTPPERAERLACLMTTCDVDRQLKAEQLDAAPPPRWWVVASAAIVTVAAAAFALGRVTAPPAPPAP